VIVVGFINISSAVIWRGWGSAADVILDANVDDVAVTAGPGSGSAGSALGGGGRLNIIGNRFGAGALLVALAGGLDGDAGGEGRALTTGAAGVRLAGRMVIVVDACAGVTGAGDCCLTVGE